LGNDYVIKRLLLVGSAALALSACASTQVAEAPATPQQAMAEPAAPAPKPEFGTFGYDAAGMDRSVAPGDDFVGYANGGWIKNTEIPADRSNYGMFARLDDLSRERTRIIIEETAAKGGAGNAQKVGDYFASFMDEAAIEAKGAQPLQADLQRVAAVKTKADLARVLGEELRTYGPTPFNMYVNQDAKDPETYIPVFVQDGLGMPDRDYYLQNDAKFVETRAKYLTHIANMLKLAGVPEAQTAAKAKNVYQLERQMARVHWTRVDSRDDDKTYNKWAKADFARRAPGFDWNAFFGAAGLGQQPAFIVSQPSAFTGMAKLVAGTPITVWKDWLTFSIAKDRAPVLSKAFVDERFAFNGTVLSGQPQLQPRWKRGVDAVNNAMGEAVGELYVARHFPPESKAKMDELVRNVIAAMDERLANLPWMTPETKVKARAKLAAFTPKIGYPSKWRDYSALEVVRGDAYGNAQRASRFEYDRNVAKLGKPVDRDEWFMTPMTVNAYANPTMNEIVFPAAILQPPYFDPNADPAVNYGGIGMVIGHEISHHFDDQGRKYDPQGRLTDWWTADDVKRFKVYTDQVVKQYSAYEPLPGRNINGALALGENIADLAGGTIAYEAYKKSLGGEPAPVIDGVTGDQRFFLGFAQIWRQKYRDAALQQQLTTGPHSPGHFRPYVVRNFDAWYDAFDVKPGQKLYLPPEQRVKVW
jgi:putative endopeptidase